MSENIGERTKCTAVELHHIVTTALCLEVLDRILAEVWRKYERVVPAFA